MIQSAVYFLKGDLYELVLPLRKYVAPYVINANFKNVLYLQKALFLEYGKQRGLIQV
jgi:hypothetical protein